jgi:hypothetical protein
MTRPSSVPHTGEEPLINIPEDEQWRIINRTGILDKLKEADQAKRVESDSPATFVDELFATLVYAVPFWSLLLVMEMRVLFNESQIDVTDRHAKHDTSPV